MTTIQVVYKDTGTYALDPIDGIFICQHDNAEVEQPCCSSEGSSGYIECGCAGRLTVYCYDCDNEQLTADDIEGILGY